MPKILGWIVFAWMAAAIVYNLMHPSPVAATNIGIILFCVVLGGLALKTAIAKEPPKDRNIDR
jgi:hypothetical protein